MSTHPTGQIPEHVYLDASRANFAALGYSDPAAVRFAAEAYAQRVGFRAAVESAWRAGREAAAQAILAHTDRVAPMPPSGVPDQKRRWLHTAAQVAAPTPTMAQVAEALRSGNYAACHLDEAGRPVAPETGGENR